MNAATTTPRKTGTLAVKKRTIPAAPTPNAEHIPGPHVLKVQIRDEDYIDSIGEAYLNRRKAFHLEIATALVLFMERGRADKPQKQELRRIYDRAGYQCLLLTDPDYKTVNRRNNAAANLFEKVGGAGNIRDQIFAYSEDSGKKLRKAQDVFLAVADYVESLDLHSIARIDKFVGKEASDKEDEGTTRKGKKKDVETLEAEQHGTLKDAMAAADAEKAKAEPGPSSKSEEGAKEGEAKTGEGEKPEAADTAAAAQGAEVNAEVEAMRNPPPLPHFGADAKDSPLVLAFTTPHLHLYLNANATYEELIELGSHIIRFAAEKRDALGHMEPKDVTVNIESVVRDGSDEVKAKAHALLN